MKTLTFYLGILLLGLPFGSKLYAQNQATLDGKVLFPTGIDCTPESSYNEVPDVKVKVESLDTTAMDTMTTDANGAFTLDIHPGRVKMTPLIAAPAGPSDWRNGLTTLDIIYIQKHRTEDDLIECPFKRIAADVENDGDVDSLDQVEVHRLILGISSSFSDVPNWRFVSSIYATPHSAHPHSKFLGHFWNTSLADANGNEYPFNAAFYQDGKQFTYNGPNSWMEDMDSWTALYLQPCYNPWGFYIVKSGDVNGSANIGNIAPGRPSPGPPAAAHPGELRAPGLTVAYPEGENSLDQNTEYLFTIKVQSPEPLFGYQLGIRLNTAFLEFVRIDELSNRFGQVRDRDFNLDPGQLEQGMLRTLWVYNPYEQRDGIMTAAPVTVFSMVINARQNVTGLLDYFYLDDNVMQNQFYNSERVIDGVNVMIEFAVYNGNNSIND